MFKTELNQLKNGFPLSLFKNHCMCILSGSIQDQAETGGVPAQKCCQFLASCRNTAQRSCIHVKIHPAHTHICRVCVPTAHSYNLVMRQV